MFDYGTCYISRLIFNVSEICITTISFSLNYYHVRIFVLRFTGLTAISDMDPFTSRALCVRVIHTLASLLIKDRYSTSFAIFSF